MGGSKNFGQGGSRSTCHKKADIFFIVFILVLNIFFIEVQWFISKKTIISQVSRRGSNILQWVGDGVGPIAYSL